MRKIYGVLLALLLSTAGFAQNETISGKITNDNGQALERAFVLVLDANDFSYVIGTITDKYGNFQFVDLIDGNYIVSVDHNSFEEPKILGSLNTKIQINNLNKINLIKMGSELLIGADAQELIMD